MMPVTQPISQEWLNQPNQAHEKKAGRKASSQIVCNDAFGQLRLVHCGTTTLDELSVRVKAVTMRDA
jgi:hypothetical protein